VGLLDYSQLFSQLSYFLLYLLDLGFFITILCFLGNLSIILLPIEPKLTFPLLIDLPQSNLTQLDQDNRQNPKQVHRQPNQMIEDAHKHFSGFFEVGVLIAQLLPPSLYATCLSELSV
jgi:hypothetical protein